jgi:HEAT repeat protein
VSQLVLVTALAERRDQAAAPEVAKLVASEHEDVRVAAVRALGELGGAGQVDLLVGKLSDTGETGKAAEVSLARMAVRRWVRNWWLRRRPRRKPR